MKAEKPMKRNPVVYALGSLSCGLALLACGSGNENLFNDISIPSGSDDPQGSGSEPPPTPNVENTPPEPPVMEPAPEERDPDLPLTAPGEVPPGEPVSEPPPEPVPLEPALPVIVSVSPRDGAIAVENDTELVIEFSVPMNRELTEGAYQSESIPSSGVTFSWNEESTVLTITPNEPLEYDVGTDPDEVQARRYSFFLSASAEDAEGNRMAVQEFSFSVLRQIDLTVLAVQDPDLTGSYRSNDTYGSGACAREQSNTCVGDERVGGNNMQYKGFLTFDLSVLPESMARVSSAQLNLQITGMAGNPFGGLGGLFLEHTRFDAIGADAFVAEPLAELGRIANGGTAGTVLGLDVLSAVELDLDERGTTQYRLHFEDATDGDRTADAIVSASTTQSLNLSYLIP
jgi:hypothetical protein